MKNPFKKQSIIDTAINVGVGGAANVGMDYVFANVDALASLSDTVKNGIKIGVGVIGGTMVSNKWARAAADGIATVGVSNLVSSLIEGNTEPANGLPQGTIGAIRRRSMGQRGFINRRQVAGVGVPATAVVSK